MKLLCGNTHLTSQTKLAAVSESGAGVDIDAGAVDKVCKLLCVFSRCGDDRITVMRSVSVDMMDRFSQAVNGFDGQNVIKELGVEVSIRGRCSFDHLCAGFIESQLYRLAAIGQPCFQFRKKRSEF